MQKQPQPALSVWCGTYTLLAAAAQLVPTAAPLHPLATAIVCTSHVDVIKGIAMFDKLKVPTIALVENMSYFECEHGTRYFPFGTAAPLAQ